MILDTNGIQKILPHRYPFLMVDAILEMERFKRIVGVKNVSINESFFQGHFPGKPIMPGVLIIEALAQVGAVAVLSEPAYRGKIAYFAGIDGVRFRRMVTPGDTLTLELRMEKMRRNIGKAAGIATVDGQVVAEGSLMFAIGD